MAEAQPSKKRGGHAYGRRVKQMSNTAVEGELCLYHGHSLGRFSSHSMRYDSHQACVRCVAGAREGRMSFDIDKLVKKNRVKALKFWSQVEIGAPDECCSLGRFSSHSMRYDSHQACVRCVAGAREGRMSFDIDKLVKKNRVKALKFWSQVEIGAPDECWNWSGCINKRTKQPQFAWRRHGLSSSTQHHPQRVAMWFSWGDLGYTAVKTTCGNKYCCNPFHLIPQSIGVFVDHDSYFESFELACELHTLKQRIGEYVMEEALKEQEKAMNAEDLSDREALILDPSSLYGDKFEAVMLDLLAGNHPSQKSTLDPGLHQGPTDNGEDEENPTSDY